MSTMLELIKKGVFMGLGVASLTKDKLQALVTEVQKEANLSEDQAHQLQLDLQERAAAARQDLEGEIDQRIDHVFVQLGIVKAGIKKVTENTTHEFQSFIDRRIDEALERLAIARKQDVEALEKRIALLEEKLSMRPLQ